MNKKLIGTLASVVLLTGVMTGTTSLAQEVEDGTDNEQNSQPVVTEQNTQPVEQNTQPVVTEQKSEPVEQNVVVEQAQEVVEENTSNEVDNVENNETDEVQSDDIQSELEVDEVDTSIDENVDVNEEDKKEIEAPDLSEIEPEVVEEEVLEEDVVEYEESEESVEVQSNKYSENETRHNQHDTSVKKPKQNLNNDTSEEIVEDEETSLDEITPDITESQPLALHDAGSETKYIVELDKEETEEEVSEDVDLEKVEEADEEVSEDVDLEKVEETNDEESTSTVEDLDGEHETDVDEATGIELDEENVDEATESDLNEEQTDETEVDETEAVDEDLKKVDDAELSEPVLVEEPESHTPDTHQLSEHEVTALNQSFDNTSNYGNSFTFEVDNTVDNDWQNILNERGTEHITFEREGIEVSIERLENGRIEVTYAFRDALDNMSEEELESFIYGEYQKDKVNINEGGQTEFLTKRITDRLNDTSSNPSIVHGASETTLSTPQELPKTGIALIGGTVGSALALLFSGAFAGLFSLRRK